MPSFYTFNPPYVIGGDKCTKPGITNGDPDDRLGKYQLPYGPCWEAHYTWLCSHPDIEVIKWIEGSVLGHFRHKSGNLGPGMTEWLVDTSWREVREFVLKLCQENNIEIYDHGEGPWTPVRIQNEIKNLR